MIESILPILYLTGIIALIFNADKFVEKFVPETIYLGKKRGIQPINGGLRTIIIISLVILLSDKWGTPTKEFLDGAYLQAEGLLQLPVWRDVVGFLGDTVILSLLSIVLSVFVINLSWKNISTPKTLGGMVFNIVVGILPIAAGAKVWEILFTFISNMTGEFLIVMDSIAFRNIISLLESW